MEKSGEGQVEVDPDLEEEWEEEGELEEEGIGKVEYVSDIESESDDEDLEDLEDWIESGSSDEGSVEGELDEEEDQSEGEDDDDTDKLKKAIQNLKRKRTAPKTQKPSKKISKGPKQTIEYEMEPPRPVLETV